MHLAVPELLPPASKNVNTKLMEKYTRLSELKADLFFQLCFVPYMIYLWSILKVFFIRLLGIVLRIALIKCYRRQWNTFGPNLYGFDEAN